MTPDELVAAIREIATEGGATVQRSERIAAAIRGSGNHPWVGVYEVTDTEVAILGYDGPGAPAYPRFPRSQGLTATALATGRAVIVDDVTTDSRYLTAFGTTRSEMIVPVLGPDGVIGTIDVESDQVAAFGDADRTLLERCAEAIVPMLQQRRPSTYGFVGAGAITAAIVEGIHADGSDSPAIFLSPRGRDVAHGLSSRFANVQVCDSNQDVLDRATTIVVAVRPQDGRAVLEELSFRPDHVVLSVMAGVQLEQLRDWVAPARQIVRVIPLPSAARGSSLTTIYPDDAVARELFGRVGEVLVPSEEATFDALSASTATFAAHLDYLATIAGWLADNGLDDDAATAFTTHIFGQLGQTLSQQSDSLAALTEKHMTPGGTNQQFMTDLRRDGVPDSVRRALDRIFARLRG